MKREFYYQDDRSNKFWCIELQGSSFTSWNGRVGSKARETRKDFTDENQAKREYEKLIAEKIRNGYQEGSAPPYQKTDWSKLDMSEDVFWRLIALFNWKKCGDDEAVMEPAIQALSQMSPEAIQAFEDILSEKLYSLDTLAHARQIGSEAYQEGKHFSVDWFLYQRCCVVANGKEMYATVLAHAGKMPKDMEFEALLTLASTAFELKTGQEFKHQALLSYETFSNQAGWQDAICLPRHE